MIDTTFPIFQQPVYTYNAEVIRIVDADTLDVLLDFGCHIYVKKRLRLLGIDTWETRGEERTKGLIAKEYVEKQMVISRNKIVVQTKMDAVGKYGRLLAWVWIDSTLGYLNLNKLLLEEGHGVVPNY